MAEQSHQLSDSGNMASMVAVEVAGGERIRRSGKEKMGLRSAGVVDCCLSALASKSWCQTSSWPKSIVSATTWHAHRDAQPSCVITTLSFVGIEGR